MIQKFCSCSSFAWGTGREKNLTTNIMKSFPKNAQESYHLSLNSLSLRLVGPCRLVWGCLKTLITVFCKGFGKNKSAAESSSNAFSLFHFFPLSLSMARVLIVKWVNHSLPGNLPAIWDHYLPTLTAPGLDPRTRMLKAPHLQTHHLS